MGGGGVNLTTEKSIYRNTNEINIEVPTPLINPITAELLSLTNKSTITIATCTIATLTVIKLPQ